MVLTCVYYLHQTRVWTVWHDGSGLLRSHLPCTALQVIQLGPLLLEVIKKLGFNVPTAFKPFAIQFLDLHVQLHDPFLVL